MFKIFFLLLLAVPLIELFVLIEVGSEIGAVPTITLTILTAVVGAWLMRTQGVSTMQRAQQSMAVGQLPEKEMLEGVFIFIGGLFLLIPGFITDALGFLFLVPAFRQSLANNFVAQQKKKFHGNVYETEWQRGSGSADERPSIKYRNQADGDVIEGEIVDDTHKK